MPAGVRDALDDARRRARRRPRPPAHAARRPEQPLIKLRRVTCGLGPQPGAAGHRRVHADRSLQRHRPGVVRRRPARRQSGGGWCSRSLLAQIPRVPAAVSTMGSMQQPLPLGPLTALQFAICYVNLAIPSTAARVAINVRFFQRFGVKPATAISAGVIDSVSGFVVQIALFLLLFFASDVDLGSVDGHRRRQRPGDDRADRRRRRSSSLGRRRRARRPGPPAGRRGVPRGQGGAARAALAAQAAAAVRRQRGCPGAVRRRPGRVCRGVRRSRCR